MKKRYIIIIVMFIFLNFSYSQIKKIVIFDKFNNSVVENAFLKFDDSINFVSDKNGLILLKKFKNENFSISHLSYKPFRNKFSLITDTIFLETKFNSIDEITINNKVVKILKPKKAFGNLNPRNYGGGGAPLDEKLIYAIYIPNKTGKEFYINEVSLEPTGYSLVYGNGKLKEKFENHKYAPFKLDIYSNDSIYNIPKQSILKEPVIIILEKDKKFATASFDEKFVIDNNGFFIVLTALEKSYYENIGFKSSPAFNTIQADKETKYLMLTKNIAVEDSIWKQDLRNRDYNTIFNFSIQIEN
ncbi:hypothetical protein [Flavobacterium facile]|uniref:hypothetical protein n=1 Tax=Flavobacterium facile TaxID=2893174 RepID=UPI002E760862|nr:hypothetical protein [Flavobacterium sp. T-12]